MALPAHSVEDWVGARYRLPPLSLAIKGWVAALALTAHGLPLAIFMALNASYFRVIPVQGIARHGCVVEQQVLTFPAAQAVALGAVRAQNPLVRIILLVAGGTGEVGSGCLPQHADFRQRVACATLRSQVGAG